jgi:hypothetical protein
MGEVTDFLNEKMSRPPIGDGRWKCYEDMDV